MTYPIPLPSAARADRAQLGVSLPRSVYDVLSSVAAERDATISDTAEVAILQFLDVVSAEGGKRSRRVHRYESGTRPVTFSVAADTVRRVRAAPGRSISHIVKRCIALAYMGTDVAPAAPVVAPATSRMFVVHFPATLHAWLLGRPEGLSKVVRTALDAHVERLAADASVGPGSAARAPGMVAASVRLPVHMHAAMLDAARQRGTNAGAIARLAVAAHVRDLLAKRQST